MSAVDSRRVSARVALLEPFLAMEIMERAFEMEAAGTSVIHLEIGEPDFAPPVRVIEACEEALRAGETHYSDSRGLGVLREAIVRDHRRRAGVSLDPDRVIVTQGTSPAMLLVFSLLVGAGDEVILSSPHYPCYPNFIRHCGGEPIFVPSRPETGFAMELDAIRSAITSRTRAIVVSSPANPTGAVQSEATLRGLAELGPALISDEVYGGLVYGGAQAMSGLELPGDVFVLDGFSKRYAMTGFRLGWLVAPDWAIRPLQIMQQNLFISANRFVQHAGVAALEAGGEQAEAMRRAYEQRRDRMLAGLLELGLEVPRRPDGAFYIFTDARRFGSDSRELAWKLLERARVGVTPGIDFGAAGEGMLRFCYAVSEAAIDEGLARLGEVLPGLARGGEGGRMR